MAINKKRIGRYSTQTIEQYGAQRKVSSISGSYANKYRYGTGNESFYSPDNISSGYNNLKKSSINPKDYGVVFSYFEGITKSKAAADSLTLVLFDVSKMLDIPIHSALNSVKKSKEIFVPEGYHAFINILRPESNQHERTRKISNSSSIVGRSIKP